MRPYIVCLSTFLIGFSLTACRTNTILDGFAYPSEPYWSQIENNESLELCSSLEEQDYVFDQFMIDEQGIEISYSDDEKSRYSQTQSITPIMVTSINRDFNNAESLSDEELERLRNEAENFCIAYYDTSRQLGIDLELSGIYFWDYIAGVRGGFALSDACEISHSYSWSTGSYANRYEEIHDANCPSGRVEY